MTDRDTKELLNTLHSISRAITSVAKELNRSTELTLHMLEAAENVEAENTDDGFAYDDENPIAEEAPEEDE